METLSLFDMTEDVQEKMDVQPTASLDVVRMEFAGAETLTWRELFSGFDTLHAITYSSGIDFIYQLIDLFDQAEILFGCDEVISYSLQEVMAYQCKMVERMRNTASEMKLDLVARVDDGTILFWTGIAPTYVRCVIKQKLKFRFTSKKKTSTMRTKMSRVLYFKIFYEESMCFYSVFKGMYMGGPSLMPSWSTQADNKRKISIP